MKHSTDASAALSDRQQLITVAKLEAQRDFQLRLEFTLGPKCNVHVVEKNTCSFPVVTFGNVIGYRAGTLPHLQVAEAFDLIRLHSSSYQNLSSRLT